MVAAMEKISYGSSMLRGTRWRKGRRVEGRNCCRASIGLSFQAPGKELVEGVGVVAGLGTVTVAQEGDHFVDGRVAKPRRGYAGDTAVFGDMKLIGDLPAGSGSAADWRPIRDVAARGGAGGAPARRIHDNSHALWHVPAAYGHA